MAQFPTALLQPENGFFGPHPLEGYFIRVPLKPFELLEEMVETSARLDCVSLPTNDLSALAGQTLPLPVDSDEDPIDGSIYIGNRHHPIDVYEITFGQADDTSIHAAIGCDIDFEVEGLEDFEKTAWKFEVRLQWTDKPQHA
jgi:hypothetical protein